MSDALWQLSACRTAASLPRRQPDAAGRGAGACLARMDAVNPRLNAVVARRDDARAGRGRGGDAALRAGRAAVGARRHPAHGEGQPVHAPTCPPPGARAALRDHRPAHDELAAGRARAGGALLDRQDQRARSSRYEGYTANPLFGVTGNPWNPALTPGGSSGGAVAAVAAASRRWRSRRTAAARSGARPRTPGWSG